MFKFFFLFVFLSANLFAQDKTSITFLRSGTLVKVLPLGEISKLSPSMDVTVYEPHEKKNVTYHGFPFRPILEKVYGIPLPKGEIKYIATDNYSGRLSMERVLKYDAYLAISRADKKDFTLDNRLQNESGVSLGPFYLVWDNVKHKDLERSHAYGWPYCVATFDLDPLPDDQAIRPTSADPAIQKGFVAAKKYCLSCHTLNDYGGGKSRELNSPNVTMFYTLDRFRTLVTNPQKIRASLIMPSIPPEDHKLIDDLYRYFQHMKSAKD